MDDLDFLSSDSVNSKVENVLGYKPKQSTKTNPNNLGNLRPVGSSKGFQQTESMEQGIKDIDNQLRIYGEKHGVKKNNLLFQSNRYKLVNPNQSSSFPIEYLLFYILLVPRQTYGD